MHVLATAGHVDHGKSSLVRALTGTDPDRLAEEQRRGLTLELGHAWTTLPSGARVAFVDVPGHQRYLGTTVSGFGPPVVLVVAADGGWARQSAEHLAALDALGVTDGLLVITRCDLADPGPAADAAQAALRGSSLGELPWVAVSARTGEGLPEVRTALDALVARAAPADPEAPVRLWVDRSFTVHGTGTVVTGTLVSGSIAVGDRLQLGDHEVGVRGLQVLEAQVERVSGPARVALNTKGPHPERGDVLLTPGAWHSTAVLDARLTADVAEQVVLHLGTAALPVRVRPLGSGFARITCPFPLPLRYGDRALLRDPAGQRVAAGIVVLDPDPPPLTRRGAAARRAEALASFDVVRERGLARVDDLVRQGFSPREGTRGWAVDPGWWDAQVASLLARVDDGPGVADLGPLAEELVRAAGLEVHQGVVRRPGMDPGPEVAALLDRLRDEPWSGEDHGLSAEQLGAAERAGALLRLGPVVVLPDAPERAVAVLRTLDPPWSVAQARTALGARRQVAVPLLEHLDRTGRTLRVTGGMRRVRDT